MGLPVSLFANGAMSGHLTLINGDEEPVLVLGFDAEGDPLCVDAAGLTNVRASYIELYLDWRFENGRWLTTEEIEAAKGALDEPDD